MKVFFRRIHLYLSFAAGLVILLCCLTGAILVFEKDLMMAFNKDRYYVKPEGSKKTLAELQRQVKSAFPGAKITGVKTYTDPERSVEFNLTPAADKKAGREGAGSKTTAARQKGAEAPRQPGFTAFVNPYTGAVLEKYSYRETFFYQVFAMHRWLLGGQNSIGKYIVGISTLLFLFILLTGIILWWPRTRRIMVQRLRIKWNAGWKRVNHDFHLVFGFYSAIFLFIFAFTGLAWSFEWFNNGIYKLTNSPLKPTAPPHSTYVAGRQPLGFDQALASAAPVAGQTEYYQVNVPKDSLDPITVTVLPTNAPHESATTAVYVDQYAGSVLGMMRFSDRSLGAQVRSSFKPIHTGSIWGTPSKIIAFIVCLLGVTFPITGTIMWYNRTRKRRRNQGVPDVTREEEPLEA